MKIIGMCTKVRRDLLEKYFKYDEVCERGSLRHSTEADIV
jgi:hypothetical protein